MFDSTLGLLIIYLLLKIVTVVVDKCHITPLKSGHYGMWMGVLCTTALLCV